MVCLFALSRGKHKTISPPLLHPSENGISFGSQVTLSTWSSLEKRKPSSSVRALSEGSYGILSQHPNAENYLTQI